MPRWLPALATLLTAIGLALWLPAVSASTTRPEDELGAALVSGAVVGFALFFAQQSITASNQRSGLTAAYFSTLTSPEMSRAVVRAQAFLSGGAVNPGAAWTSWREMSPDQQVDILQSLNFLEQVGYSYESGEVDRDAIAARFGALVEAMWESGAWFVARVRELAGASIFAEWESMTINVKGRKRFPHEISATRLM